MATVTWNPSDKGAGISLSNGNLTATNLSGSTGIRATEGRLTGKWYWEVTVDVSAYPMIGIANANASMSANTYDSQDARYYYGTGNKYPGAGAYGAAFSTGDTVGVALDLNAGTLTFYKNGVSQGIAFSDIASMGKVFPCLTAGSAAAGQMTANFGATAFKYAVPAGYQSYNISALYLIKTPDEKLKAWTGSAWNVVGTNPPTETLFTTSGMSALDAITQAQWSLLGSTFDILTFSTDAISFSVSVPIRPIDVFNDKSPELLTWVSPPEAVPTVTAGGFVSQPKYHYKVELDDTVSPEQPDLVIVPYGNYVFAKTVTSALIPGGTVNKLNPYKATITVEQDNGKTVKKDVSILLYNTAPFVQGTAVAGVVNVTLGDAEHDQMKYRIKVNGVRKYPANDEWSELVPSPFKLEYKIDANDIKFGQDNTVVIEVQDQFGVGGDLTLTFVGDHYGLLFVDTNGECYSNDIGEVLKYLDMGVLIAGQTSLVAPVFVTNKTPFKVQNLLLTKDRKTLPQYAEIELSQTDSPFVASDSLMFPGVLNYGEQAPFFVRIVTQKQARGSGDFDILVKADLAE